MDRHATLEIEDRHDAHREREDSTHTRRPPFDRAAVIAEVGPTR
jgi:hypothetical protein